MAQRMSAVPFLDALHADKPLRVWSLIVTIFGDIVMRRGRDADPAPIWTGHLLDLLQCLGVDAGLVRTSLSRLVANGVLVRERAGGTRFTSLAAAVRLNS
jgi:phenylacetic acid degradation operon negative regulatory protein